MNVWRGLLKKEYRLGLPVMVIELSVLFLCIGFAFFLEWKTGRPDFLIVTSVMLLFFHCFFLFVYMPVSLALEKKRMHLWLHNPASGAVLLSAKMAAGLLFMVASLFITSLFVLYSCVFHYDVFQESNVTGLHIFRIGILIILHIIVTSLQLGIWISFIWGMDQLLQRLVGKVASGVAVALFFIGSVWLLTKMASSQVYTYLTHWGQIHVVSLFTSDQLDVKNFSYNLYIGELVFDSLVALLLFFITSWIIDRKVEV
ncbi:hypothetical protein WD019_07265 [Fictibacillus sp. Mic-4]|uniref:hypothetical protein n=1 Tax=Fictibacillus TaxID=1329200 RepID=UPI00040E4ECF|nr:hypothetical protein [Fictibacillus gelatini]